MSGAAARARASAATAALASFLFLVLPAWIYVGNSSEFLLAPGRLAAVLLAPVLLVVVLTMVGLRIATDANLSRYTAIMAALTLLAWIQSYLLVWDYGHLDGRPIDWGSPWWRGWVDLPLWIAGLAAAAAFHRRLGAALLSAALVALVLQAALLGWTAYGQRDAFASKASRHDAANAFEAMPRFSRQRNVVHIVLDSFQADVFAEIIEGRAGPHVRKALGGFTFFEDTLGAFPGTYFSLPVIVSGRAYRNDVPRQAYIDATFSGRTVLNAAHGAGFEVDLASEAAMLDMLMKGRFDNAYLIARPPLVEEAARLLDLALFRAAPHWLKRGIYNNQRWMLWRWVTGSDLMAFHYFRHNAFLVEVTNRLSVDRDAPVYKFFHLLTTHEPYVVRPDCGYGGVVERARETIAAQSRCSLAFVIALFERMKQGGIYDDSLIVIMGDHGAHLPPRRYRHGTIVAGDASYDLKASFVGVATPLLAIKPAGATGPLQVSAVPGSMSQVPATLDALLQLHGELPGISLLDPERDPAAARSFYGIDWPRDEPLTDYVRALQEFRVTGSAYDSKSWHLGDYLPAPAAH